MFAYGVFAIAMLGVAVFAPTWLTPSPTGLTGVLLPYLGARFAAVDLAALIAAAPGVIAMYRIRGACQRGEGQAADLVAWRAILQAQLAALGAFIVLGTLATGALRNAILDAYTIRPDDLPAEGVLLIGASLTVIVALMYVPPSEQLRRRAQAMVDETFPLPRQLDGDWQQHLQRRRDLAALLRIDESSPSSIQNALIIGGPLIASALTLLVPAH
ncbi:hypothetical protein [Micromonospora kangleipakensis]|uniref:hypothetical protein n=1 Tax=Micromonospora kangleipakensis TaxID=1077942 RepID=UPI001028D355|nr:hypothetical protein [Micromonospora kangleipakensis]